MNAKKAKAARRAARLLNLEHKELPLVSARPGLSTLCHHPQTERGAYKMIKRVSHD